MAPSMNSCFYGILPSHIYKNIWLHHFLKKNTVLVFEGDKIKSHFTNKTRLSILG